VEYTRYTIKVVILGALLIGAGCFLGLVCGWVEGNYDLLFDPSMATLYLGLKFFGALAAVAVAAGLVAVLIRPFRICALVFGLSAVGMFAVWDFAIISFIMAVVYLLGGLAYCWGVRGEMKSRLKFSVWHILRSQAILLVVLIAVGCAGLYAGYSDEVDRDGFAFPPAIIDNVVETAAGEIDDGLTPAEKAAAEAELRADVENIADLVESRVEASESYVPVGFAAVVFLPLSTIALMLSWIPILVLAVIFIPLASLKLVNREVETVNITRLSL